MSSGVNYVWRRSKPYADVDPGSKQYEARIPRRRRHDFALCSLETSEVVTVRNFTVKES